MSKKNKGPRYLLGAMLASVGLGMFLAFILPLHLTISFFGIALIGAGIWLMVFKK